MPGVPARRPLCPLGTPRAPGPGGTRVAREQSRAGVLPALGTGQVFVLWGGGNGDSFAVPFSPSPPAPSSSSAWAALHWGCGQGWQRVSTGDGSGKGMGLRREGGGR